MPKAEAKLKSATEFYYFNDLNEDVYLRVFIGYKQNAESTVTLDLDPIRNSDGGIYFTREIKKLFIGQPTDLIGRDLYIETQIDDISTETDKMSYIIELWGGGNSYRYRNEATVTSNSDSYSFRIRFSE